MPHELAEATYLFPSEFFTLMSCEEIPLDWRRLIALSVYFGTRARELQALTWDDVDVERGILHGTTRSVFSTARDTRRSTRRRSTSVEPRPSEMVSARCFRCCRRGSSGRPVVAGGLVRRRSA